MAVAAAAAVVSAAARIEIVAAAAAPVAAAGIEVVALGEEEAPAAAELQQEGIASHTPQPPTTDELLGGEPERPQAAPLAEAAAAPLAAQWRRITDEVGDTYFVSLTDASVSVWEIKEGDVVLEEEGAFAHSPGACLTEPPGGDAAEAAAAAPEADAVEAAAAAAAATEAPATVEIAAEAAAATEAAVSVEVLEVAAAVEAAVAAAAVAEAAEAQAEWKRIRIPNLLPPHLLSQGYTEATLHLISRLGRRERLTVPILVSLGVMATDFKKKLRAAILAGKADSVGSGSGSGGGGGGRSHCHHGNPKRACSEWSCSLTKGVDFFVRVLPMSKCVSKLLPPHSSPTASSP